MLISPAERKTFVLFLYYLFFGVLQLTTHSLLIKDIDCNIMVVYNYSRCQRSGINQSCSLDTTLFIEMFSLLPNILVSLLPVISLFLIINIRGVLVSCKSCFYRVTQFHDNTASSSVS